MNETTLPWIAAIAAAISSLSIFFSFFQVYFARKQLIAVFEEKLSSEYRNIVNHLPSEAILGKKLIDAVYQDKLDNFIHYFDLCNEQIFYRSCGRVSKATWIFWRDGIKSNLSLEAFRKAWTEIKQDTPEVFRELRKLEKSGYLDDPRTWSPRSWYYLKLLRSGTPSLQ